MKGSMASSFLPVETILKVDDTELIGSNGKSREPACASSTNFVSIGTQCDWKVDPSDDKICNLLPVTDNGAKYDLINPGNLPFGERNDELPLVIRGWPTQCDPTISSADQKFIIPATFSQQFACNIQTLPIDEKFFLQFDYKTRNKLKTKQRRLDPYYRTQERVRQRTVMRIKRQDPRFRAAEREKGRYRMRLKRLDPVFRSQERERQRERMKLKRSNPDFREREREQQKTRLHVKRLDPAFKEKERAQDLLRMRLKRQSESIYSTAVCDPEKMKMDSKTESASVITEHPVFKEVDETGSITELRSNQVVFHDGFNAKLLSIRPREPNIETFHFKKQHILNFNFYNSSKEQWPSADEINAKSISQFSVTGDSVKLEEVTESNMNILEKSKYFQSRKTYSKNDLIGHTIIDIKSEAPSISEIGKEKDTLISDSSTILSYTPSLGN